MDFIIYNFAVNTAAKTSTVLRDSIRDAYYFFGRRYGFLAPDVAPASFFLGLKRVEHPVWWEVEGWVAERLDVVVWWFCLFCSLVFCLGALVLSWRLFRWLRWEIAAANILRYYDGHDQGFAFEKQAAVEEDQRLDPGEEGKPITRWYRSRRLGLAHALAEEAYYQFGARERTEAELLVTRKFMRDWLKEHRDLRAKDAAQIIDQALYLSFLPSTTLRDMRCVAETRRYRMRESHHGSWWHWWGPTTDRPLL